MIRFPKKEKINSAYCRNGRLFIPLITCWYFFSCGPVIHFFSVDQQTITADDSIKLTWSVQGKPTLLVHTDTAVNNEDDNHPEYREFTLVAQKNGKEVKKVIQVIVRPVESTDNIIFPTVRKGDTLIATGEKNIALWGSYFNLKTVASGSARELTVMHSGKTVILDKDSSPSTSLAGLPNSGLWEIRSLLTEAEKKDTTTIPAKLIIHSVIVHQKP